MADRETAAVRQGRYEEKLDHLIRAVDEMKATQRTEIAELRKADETLRTSVQNAADEQEKIKGRVDLIVGNFRAFGMGFAAAFMLIGAGIGAGFRHLVDLFV